MSTSKVKISLSNILTACENSFRAKEAHNVYWKNYVLKEAMKPRWFGLFQRTKEESEIWLTKDASGFGYYNNHAEILHRARNFWGFSTSTASILQKASQLSLENYMWLDVKDAAWVQEYSNYDWKEPNG